MDDGPMADDDLMTTEELAKRWKMKPKTLDNWRSARVGPEWVKIRGAVRYRRRAVDMFERAGEQGGGSAA